MTDLPPLVIARFWSKVKVAPKRSRCWEWQGSRHGKGYGHFRLNGQIEKAHRVAYLIAVGSIPEGMQVLHDCDNPPCCNPRHLWLGQNDDNLADRQRKKRHAHGEKHARAILTEADVRTIRRSSLAHSRLAGLYGVSKGAISHAKTGRSWKHVT